ncbi:hypothetical protein Hypma_003608 [Hypsizygus marmoreus]|uniref:Uncharacterized protein n=1 Tax=Hypsizygus marmoreus TaxID=39966 RepID=A0A369J1T4_HYPMA|nr:hypothetical protein Hypma_003608 [Hypsizygus marmoreus]
MPFLFPEHGIGYRDPPEDFMGDEEHWDGVPFPESPTIRPRSLEPNLATSPSLVSLDQVETTSDNDIVGTVEVDLESLHSLSPCQVMYSTWPVAILATGGYAQ